MLVAASAAHAQSMLVIDGAGDGHGVGMSQVGAEGLAVHGYSYQQILAHYYTGTAIAVLPATQTVTVLLQSGRRSVGFSGGAFANTRRLGVSVTYRAVPRSGGRIELENSRRQRLATLSAPALISGPGALTLRGRALDGVKNGIYDGSLELVRHHSAIDVVNVVELESYLSGVVPAESSASWQPAELEAQAVAARSYAITTKVGSEFDLYSDTRSQQYDGVGVETAATSAAVAATAGQVVTYNGVPVATYYFASSGGETENIENAMLGATPEPWLVAVLDPYDSSRFGPIKLPLARAKKKLGKLLDGTLEAINVTQRGVSPRVVAAQVVGSKGTTSVTGPQLEQALGLPSTWACFDVTGRSGTPPADWDAACAAPTGPPTQGGSGASGASGSSGGTGSYGDTGGTP
jgi:stage II sporulation protein D